MAKRTTRKMTADAAPKLRGPWVSDGLKNVVSGMGMPGQDKFASLQYAFCEITRAQAEAAYRSDWVAQKIIDLPAQDATREWREWHSDQKDIEAIEEVEDDLGIQRKTMLALTKARLYGGGALLIGVDDGLGMDKPLNLETVKKGALKFVHALSRYELTTESAEMDVMSENFGRPKGYHIAGSESVNSAQIIHPSRIVRLVGKELPSLTISSAQGWGDSILQSVFDAVKQVGLVVGSGAQLIQELKIDVIKIPELTAQSSDEDTDARLRDRFGHAALAKSLYNVLLLDKEEEWNRIEANLTGLPDALKMYLMIACAAADIAATRFLGQSPAGLNATGESDLRNYYDSIKTLQTTTLHDEMKIFNEVIVRSALGTMPDGLTYEWAPLWQMDDKTKAEVQKSKADSFQIDVNSGAFPLEVLSEARINQLLEDGTYPGLEQIIDDFEAGKDVGIVPEPDPALMPAIDPATGLPVPPKVDPKTGKPVPPAVGKAPPSVSAQKSLPAKPKPSATGDMAARIRSAKTRRPRRKMSVKPKAAYAMDSAPQSLYVRRDVLNGAEILSWAKAAGFKTDLKASDLHVTIMYSRKPVDWTKIGASDGWGENADGSIDIKPGGMRLVDKFGNAAVLCFASSALCWRASDLKMAGCESDHEEYTPHITITYNSADQAPADLSAFVAYQGAIKLGPEIWEALDPVAHS